MRHTISIKTIMRFSILPYALYAGLSLSLFVSADPRTLRRSLQSEEGKDEKLVDTGYTPVVGNDFVQAPGVYDYCPIPETLPFNFGTESGDIYTLPNDDGSSIPLALSIPMHFLGQQYTVAYQNTNGHISFQEPLSSFYWEFLPTSQLGPLAAAYWTDIYTGNDGLCMNDLWFRYSEAVIDTTTANAIVSQATGNHHFAADAVLLATWYKVDSLLYQNASATFQLAMAWDQSANATWAILAYDELEYAQAASGFNDGVGLRGGLVDIFSDMAEAEALLEGSNIGLPGIYAYQVDQNFISDIVAPTVPPTAAPTPCGVPPQADLPFPYGDLAGDTYTGPNDDGSSSPIPLNNPIHFLGEQYSIAFQNTNGHVTFGNSSFRYSWEYLPSATVEPMAAILWTDIFTGSDGGCRNDLWVRYSENSEDLAIASALLAGNRTCIDHHQGCGSSSSKGGSDSASCSTGCARDLRSGTSDSHVDGSDMDDVLVDSSSKGKGYVTGSTGKGSGNDSSSGKGQVDGSSDDTSIDSDNGKGGSSIYKATGSASVKGGRKLHTLYSDDSMDHSMWDMSMSKSIKGASKTSATKTSKAFGKGDISKGKGTSSSSSSSSSKSTGKGGSSSVDNGHYSSKGSSKGGGDGLPCALPFDAVLVATWYRVESFAGISGPVVLTNTFQLALAWNAHETWAIFVYDQLEFFASSARGSAIGFNGQDGSQGGLVGVVSSLEDAQVLVEGSNVGQPGVYAFKVSETLSGVQPILPIPVDTAVPTVAPYCGYRSKR